MTRKNPNARRAIALTLLTSFMLVLAAESCALFNPTSAQAGTLITTPSRRPMPGDPNTPDEGRTGGLNQTATKSSPWFFIWIKGIAHLTFIAR
jgi:hypothetical protein